MRPRHYCASQFCMRIPGTLFSCIYPFTIEMFMQSMKLICTQVLRPSIHSFLMPLRGHRDIFCACEYHMRVPESSFSYVYNLTTSRASRPTHTSGFYHVHIWDVLLMYKSFCHWERVNVVLCHWIRCAACLKCPSHIQIIVPLRDFRDPAVPASSFQRISETPFLCMNHLAIERASIPILRLRIMCTRI